VASTVSPGGRTDAHDESLIHQALRKANSATIHDIITVVAYLRNVNEMLRLKDDGKHERRREEQVTYRWILQTFVDTGSLPKH